LDNGNCLTLTATQCFAGNAAIPTTDVIKADSVTGACKLELGAGQCFDVTANAAASTSASVHKADDDSCVTLSDDECWGDDGAESVEAGKVERNADGTCATVEPEKEKGEEEETTTTAATATDTTTTDATTTATAKATTEGEDSSTVAITIMFAVLAFKL